MSAAAGLESGAQGQPRYQWAILASWAKCTKGIFIYADVKEMSSSPTVDTYALYS